jgi:predicted dehydrogenase
MGGGVLREFGCYPVHWCRSLVREEPEVISAEAKLTEGGVDEDATALLRFPSGVLAEIEARMSPGWDMHARLRIEGDRGSVEAVNNLLPHRGHSVVERIDGGLREHTLAGGTTFDYQLAMLVEAVASGRPVATEGADPIGNMATIDAIYSAAGIGRR